MDEEHKNLNPYTRLYDKSLSAQDVTELKHNLVGYIEVLIKMDKQHRSWLKDVDDNKKGKKNDEDSNSITEK